MTSTTNIAELRQQAKMPARQAGGSTVAKFFEANKSTLTTLLPRHVNADRMLKIALGALRTTPKLMNCTTESLFGAVVTCAQLGLEPNTPMGHAYLIPFENKRAGRFDVQVIFGYRGLIDLARRSGQIVSIAAHAVREKDDFDYEYGLDEKLKHKPASGDRGAITHFYAVAKLRDGGHAFEVMTRSDVEKIRDNSQNYKFARDKAATVWGQHFEPMGRKTAIRQLFKYLPVSIEMATASTLDGMAEGGKEQGLDGALDGEFSIVPDTEDAPIDGESIDHETGEVTQTGSQDQDRAPSVGTGSTPTAPNGETFDPELHVGPSHINADGSFRRKRGAGPARGASPKPEPQSASSSGNDGAPTLNDVYRLTAAAQDADGIAEATDLANSLEGQDREQAMDAIAAREFNLGLDKPAAPSNDTGGGFEFE